MIYDKAILYGRIISSNKSYFGNIYIKDEKISVISEPSILLDAQESIDATGLLVLPGGIDSHVHLEMPIGNFVSTDDFLTGTLAAAKGGTSSIIDFVETEKGEKWIDALKKRQALAASKSLIDYSFHMTIGPHQLDELDQIPEIIQAGCRSFKLYTAYGLALNDNQLFKVFSALAKAGGIPVVHAENWGIIQALIEQSKKEGHSDPTWHPKCRPEEIEAEAISRIAEIAHLAHCPVHIFHISTPLGMNALMEARQKGYRITAETCPQYLLLDDSAYEKPGVEGALAICSPPLRSKKAQKQLWHQLSLGQFDTISTDHCPFTREEKKQGLSHFSTIAGGVPSIEIRMAALYSQGVKTGRITLQQWVNYCSTSPAKIFNLKQKGDILPGLDADITLFDPNKEWSISPESLSENVGWTPYDGLKLIGKVLYCLNRGEVIKNKDQKGRGIFI